MESDKKVKTHRRKGRVIEGKDTQEEGEREE